MKILSTPDPFLRHTAKKVTTIDAKTLKELDQMIKTLKAATDPEGVGLAATQVGLDKQMFILILDNTPKVFLNPHLLTSSKKMFSDVYTKPNKRWLEGCLSIPKLWGFVDRPYEVTLEYQTIDLTSPHPILSSPISETFTDVNSAYVQHETDHLNGILFTDRILAQGGTIFREEAGELVPVSL